MKQNQDVYTHCAKQLKQLQSNFSLGKFIVEIIPYSFKTSCSLAQGSYTFTFKSYFLEKKLRL